MIMDQGDGDRFGGQIHKPERLTDMAYRRLREAIADFRLKPGQSIGEPEISTQLGISRNSTREALIRLESGGFVARRGGGRWFVYIMTAQDAIEIYECRALLEGLAVERNSTYATEGRFSSAPLQLSLNSAEEAFAKGDFESAAKHSGAFHDGLIAQAGNRKLVSLLDTLQPQFKFNRLIMMRYGTRTEFLSENRALLEAVCAGNGPRARLLAEEIAKGDLQAVLKLLESGRL